MVQRCQVELRSVYSIEGISEYYYYYYYRSLLLLVGDQFGNNQPRKWVSFI